MKKQKLSHADVSTNLEQTRIQKHNENGNVTSIKIYEKPIKIQLHISMLSLAPKHR